MNKPANIKGKSTGKNKTFCFQVVEKNLLMKFLLTQMPDKSRNTIKSLLAHRQVSVNNQIISKFDYPLEPDQQVKVNWNKVEEVPHYHGLKILYEDTSIIVIDKQSGLLSIATAKERQQTAYFILTEHVRKVNRKNRVYIVHRLDKDSSGVMMFAKSVEIQEKLQNDWQKAVIDRRYVVVVEGIVENTEGTITSWLKESSALIMYSYKYDNGGQKAITHYNVLKKSEDFTLLDIKLETGRKNQIRVHAQSIGHSIIGDKKYGATQNPIKRLGLHALLLAFKHPITGEDMRFETPIPKSFLSLFN
jgi:23S rRNA pseudouridine1911/1915/1917 synthase